MRRAMAGLGFLVALAACGAQPPARIDQGMEAGPVSATPSPTPRQHVPVRLRIPAIGVDAPVESVAKRADGLMDVPGTARSVAWYSPGPAPGDAAGDAVIDGHYDWTDGPAVFWRLKELHARDSIVVVADDGTSTYWSVASVGDFSGSNRPASLFATGGPAMLSLITCSGKWDGHHYSSHRIVTATPLPPSGPAVALSGGRP